MFRIILCLSILSLVILGSPAMAQQATTGAIQGTVLDTNHAPLAGATVTLTSAQGTRSATTDSKGAFRFPYLTPGTYSLSARREGYNTVDHPNIEVRLGSTSQLEVTLQPTTTEKVEVIASAPTVDVTSATTGTNIKTDVLANIPVNRSFSSVLDLAPGVTGSGIDQSNPSIGGASGLENTIVIDGVNINNTGYGSAGSYSIVLGSLGSGVSFDYLDEIQVKTGGYEPEYGEALGGYVNMITKSGTNDVRGSLYSYVQAGGLEATRANQGRLNAVSDIREFQSTDYGFNLGGPFKKDKLFWFLAVDPTFRVTTRETPVATQEALGFNHTLEVNRNIYNYAANLKWLLNSHHTFTLSAFGDPSTGDMGGQRAEAVAALDPTRKYSSIDFGGHNVIGRWTGQLSQNWLAEGSVAYHWDQFKEDLAVNEPQGEDDRSDVPVQYGGVGFFQNSTSKNLQGQLKFSNFFQAAGQHQFRWGGQYQRMGYDNLASYSGPAGLQLPDYLGGGAASSGYQWDSFVSSDGDTLFRINRIRSGPLSANTTTDYWAGFISDTWNPISNLSMMLGLRYEQETLHGTLADHTWDGNWGPRANIIWDPTKDNKSKLSFAYGRFFGKVPNDLAVRALSAEITHVITYPINNVDLTDPNNPVIRDPNDIDSSRTFSFGDVPTVIDPKSKLTYQDEFVFTAERQVAPYMKAGVDLLHRNLGRTLEDVALVPYSAIRDSGADFGNYFITNPTPEMGFPKPSRKYNAVTVRFEKNLNRGLKSTKTWDNVALGAAYTWSQLKGNYEGYYRRDNGQSDPFITSLFDFPYLKDPDIFAHMISDELLPNDRTSVFNFYGSYRFPFKLNLGTTVKIQGGTPITKLGYNEVYGNAGEIPLEARGASGRTPTIYDVGLHADYPVRVGNNRVDLIMNVFNVLNYQEATTVDMNYERSGPGDINPDFGKALTFQAPRQLQFAARYEF
jgi:outer membrane receptor for ferrienterochelin and colicin